MIHKNKEERKINKLKARGLWVELEAPKIIITEEVKQEKKMKIIIPTPEPILEQEKKVEKVETLAQNIQNELQYTKTIDSLMENVQNELQQEVIINLDLTFEKEQNFVDLDLTIKQEEIIEPDLTIKKEKSVNKTQKPKIKKTITSKK